MEELKFDDDFSRMDAESAGRKINSNSEQNIPKITPAPTDPLRNMISSDSYINSLEKKLNRIKGKQTENIRGKDIINSLQSAKQDQWTRVIDSDQQETFQEEEYYNNNSLSYNIQRKVNPEKQALNPQELFPLVNGDVLAKFAEEVTEESEVKDGT